MAAPVQPVIIVKKRGGHGGHHGGAWKVAYADFVTAMMAFFLVMWLVNQSPAVKAGVGGYFRDPVAFAEGGHGVLPGGDSIEAPKPESPPTAQAAEQERQQLEVAVSHIKEGLADVPAFMTLRDQVEFTVTPEGLRIDLLEKAESSFFDSGSATLHGEAGNLLGVIAKELGALKHDLDVEGHTDAKQYAARDGYSNWELSADRANAARRVMQRAGVRPEQVTSVRGLADRELRVPDDPFDPRNRRVSILVKSPPMKAPQAKRNSINTPPAPLPASASSAPPPAIDPGLTSAEAVAHELERAVPGVQHAAPAEQRR